LFIAALQLAVSWYWSRVNSSRPLLLNDVAPMWLPFEETVSLSTAVVKKDWTVGQFSVPSLMLPDVSTMKTMSFRVHL
jgi:hypothetical protein